MATCESNGHLRGVGDKCMMCGVQMPPYAGPGPETVDAVDQLLMMLPWEEEYTDAFKRKAIENAFRLLSGS
jgi:hypothetical protein